MGEHPGDGQFWASSQRDGGWHATTLKLSHSAALVLPFSYNYGPIARPPATPARHAHVTMFR